MKWNRFVLEGTHQKSLFVILSEVAVDWLHEKLAKNPHLRQLPLKSFKLLEKPSVQVIDAI